jgi:hypothetical protein
VPVSQNRRDIGTKEIHLRFAAGDTTSCHRVLPVAQKKQRRISYVCLVCLSSCIWLWPFVLYEEIFENNRDTPSSPYIYMDWHLNNTTMETIVLNRHFGEYYKPMTIRSASRKRYFLIFSSKHNAQTALGTNALHMRL